MATIKLSQLGALTTADANDVILITDTDAAASKKITVANLINTPISTAIANLVDSAPATLDTLNELAAALGDDANFATTVTNALATKATTTALTTHTSDTTNPHSVTKTQVGLSNVENTALSTWAGTTNITTLGTITSGTWTGTAIGDSYISSASNWNTAYGWGNHASAGYITDGFSVTAGTLTTANITTADFGGYTITETAGTLTFATGGSTKMTLDSSGVLTIA